MALSKLIMFLGLAAVVHAGFARNTNWPRQPAMPFPPFMHMRMPFPHFNFPMMKMPTPAEIAAIRPPPGTNFNAVSAQSSSKLSRDKDGNIIRSGGSTVVLNDNGQVQTYTVGNNPPDVNRVITNPSIPDFEFPEIPDIEFPEFPEIKPIKFKPFMMPETRDIRHHVPRKNEKFLGIHTSSFSESSNVNGAEFSRGGSEFAVNDNGHLDEDSVNYQQGDEEAVKKAKDHHDRFQFKPHKFIKPVIIPPPKRIDPDEIRHHVPKKNEKYVAHSTSTFTKMTNDNGHKTITGGAETIVNLNGKVEEDKVKFHQEDEPKDKEVSNKDESKDVEEDNASVEVKSKELENDDANVEDED